MAPESPGDDRVLATLCAWSVRFARDCMPVSCCPFDTLCDIRSQVAREVGRARQWSRRRESSMVLRCEKGQLQFLCTTNQTCKTKGGQGHGSLGQKGIARTRRRGCRLSNCRGGSGACCRRRGCGGHALRRHLLPTTGTRRTLWPPLPRRWFLTMGMRRVYCRR